MSSSTPWQTLDEFKARSIMPSSDVDELVRVSIEKQVADVNASDATPETPAGSAIVAACTLLWAILTPTDVLAANDTNYATVTLRKRTSGVPTVIGSVNTTTSGTGNWAPGVQVAIPLSVPGVAAGDVLSVAVTKSGTGVVVPSFKVELLPSVTFFDQREAFTRSFVEARLRKRYSIPFIAPFPSIVLEWQTAMLTLDMYRRRGFNPGSAQDQDAIIGAATTALAEIKEAADSDTGLFDLPLRDDTTASGISQGSPLGYSEGSPYVWTDQQACTGRQEDRNGRGTSS
jgi:hypothetical protein